MPDQAVGCATCEYNKQSLEEAAELLRTVIRQAHIRTGRGTQLMEARLDNDVVLKLCVWESECEDCEVGDAYGDSAEIDTG